MYKTKYSVEGLTAKLIQEYGLSGAIIILKKEYGYAIKISKDQVAFKCKDISEFQDMITTCKNTLTQEELNTLRRILG